MLDGIDFLENLGQDAQLRYASQDEVEFALSKAVVEPAMRVAILAKNGPGLQALLGQEPFCCLINPAKPSDEQGECDGSCREGWRKTGRQGQSKVKREIFQSVDCLTRSERAHSVGADPVASARLCA